MKGLCLMALAAAAFAAEPEAVRVSLQPAAGRLAAPPLALKDSAGKTVSLKKYRGKIVLLDFWATWRHGCKQEIPWFVEMQQKISRRAWLWSASRWMTVGVCCVPSWRTRVSLIA